MLAVSWMLTDWMYVVTVDFTELLSARAHCNEGSAAVRTTFHSSSFDLNYHVNMSNTLATRVLTVENQPTVNRYMLRLLLQASESVQWLHLQ